MTTDIAGAWALPRPEDELPHDPTGLRDDLPWKDTYWFGFRDDDADVTGAMHLTLSANRAPGLRAAVAFRRGGEQVLRTVYDTPTRSDDGFSSRLVSLRVLDGHWDERKHLEITVDTGEVSGVIELRGRHFGPNLALLCPGLLPTASAVELSGHAEMGVTMRADLRWRDDRLTLSGYGHRDRSWGYRKSDGMNPMGYTFVGAHLPDATVGFLGWQHPDATAADPLPVGAWLADPTGVHAATDGWYRRTAEGRPDAFGLDFANGRKVEVWGAIPTAELFYAYHEPEMEGPAIGTLSWDQHVRLESSEGPVRGIFNHGVPFLADVFRNARFCAAPGGAPAR